MKKVLLARPTYGGIDPIAARALNISMMTAAQHHVAWIGDVSVDREGWSKTRNMSHSAAVMFPEADGVLWTDDDMVPSHIAIAQLISADKDFVSGLCFERRSPHKPTFAVGSQAKGYHRGQKWPDQSLMPVDAFGFAFVYTSMALLRAVGPRPFTGALGEDYRFCELSKKHGFTAWVDTGCQVGHIADPRIINQVDYERAIGTYRASDKLPVDVNPPKPKEVDFQPPRPLGSEPELVN